MNVRPPCGRAAPTLSSCARSVASGTPPILAIVTYLFDGAMMRDTFEFLQKSMVAAIENEPEDAVSRVDVDEWAAALAHHYAMDCPRLTGEVEQSKPRETTIDVTGDHMRDFGFYPERARHYKAHAVNVYWKFEGDPQVFRLNPQRIHMSNPPIAEIKGDELVQEIKWAHDKPAPIDQEAERFKGSVENFLEAARTLIGEYNGNLERVARTAIEARLGRLRARDEDLSQSKIPVRHEVTRTYIPDVLRRRPAPRLLSTRADRKPPALEPELPDHVFEHILRVLRDALHAMEDGAPSYSGMGEEQRRDQLLTVLRTHYDGATAETINKGGHTDILIRHEGRNLFIGECKFWSGPAGYRDAIDQLFGYAGWRDTKLAVIMFVRAKGMGDVIQKGRVSLEAHPQFVAARPAAEEGELRATMRWPDEEERTGDLNVFFVHTPE
jgi:hypothetical protein